MPEQNIAEKIAAIEANGFAVYRDLKCLVALPIAPDEQLFNVTSILESQKCGLNLLNWTQAHNARAFFYDPRAKTIGIAALRQEFQWLKIIDATFENLRTTRMKFWSCAQFQVHTPTATGYKFLKSFPPF